MGNREKKDPEFTPISLVRLREVSFQMAKQVKETEAVELLLNSTGSQPAKGIISSHQPPDVLTHTPKEACSPVATHF